MGISPLVSPALKGLTFPAEFACPAPATARPAIQPKSARSASKGSLLAQDFACKFLTFPAPKATQTALALVLPAAIS